MGQVSILLSFMMGGISGSAVAGAARAETVDDPGMIMMAGGLGYAMTVERAPQEIAEFVTSLSRDPRVILMLAVKLPPVSGMFPEGAGKTLVDHAHRHAGADRGGGRPDPYRGLAVFLINPGGGQTPPVGVIMFTVCGIPGVKTGEHATPSVPFFIVLVASFVLVALAPGISTLPPRLLLQAGAWAMVRA